VQPVLSGVAVGAGWQALVAYVNIVCYYVFGVPLGLILGYKFDFGVMGIWIGMISGTVVQTVILFFLTYRTNWKKEAKDAKADQGEGGIGVVSIISPWELYRCDCNYGIPVDVSTESNNLTHLQALLTPLLAFSIVINSVQPVLSGVAVVAGWQALVAINILGWAAMVAFGFNAATRSSKNCKVLSYGGGYILIPNCDDLFCYSDHFKKASIILMPLRAARTYSASLHLISYSISLSILSNLCGHYCWQASHAEVKIKQWRDE
ncbi:Detoxification-like protein, partial [Thalictrum thalictroides]